MSAILAKRNFLVGFVFFALLDIRFPKTHEKNPYIVMRLYKISKVPFYSIYISKKFIKV